MARLRDWMDLGKSTFSSLRGRDMANLYAVEWPQTKKILIADHLQSIEEEPKQVRRAARTASAIMYGLVKRLAPHRRVLFVAAEIAFFFCLMVLYSEMRHPPFWTFVEVAATFLIITLLLAMELIDKVKYRDELELARDLQANLIPKMLPQTASFETAAFNHIANTVGGDIYDFVLIPDGRLAVLFGDASGHGMAAGLVMAVAHAAFRTQLDVDPAPSAIMGTLNRILCRTGGPRSFFAACYLLLSPDGSYSATVAGHPQILKIDSGGRVVARIGRGAYPLGIKNNLEWQSESGGLHSDERLLLHSDGLSEARNGQGLEFGDESVETICNGCPDASASSLVDTIVNRWRVFTADMAAEDDVSVAVVRRTALRTEC